MADDQHLARLTCHAQLVQQPPTAPSPCHVAAYGVVCTCSSFTAHTCLRRPNKRSSCAAVGHDAESESAAHLVQASGLRCAGTPRQLTVSSVFPEDTSSAYAVLQCLPTCAPHSTASAASLTALCTYTGAVAALVCRLADARSILVASSHAGPCASYSVASELICCARLQGGPCGFGVLSSAARARRQPARELGGCGPAAVCGPPRAAAGPATRAEPPPRGDVTSSGTPPPGLWTRSETCSQTGGLPTLLPAAARGALRAAEIPGRCCAPQLPCLVRSAPPGSAAGPDTQSMLTCNPALMQYVVQCSATLVASCATPDKTGRRVVSSGA